MVDFCGQHLLVQLSCAGLTPTEANSYSPPPPTHTQTQTHNTHPKLMPALHQWQHNIPSLSIHTGSVERARIMPCLWNSSVAHNTHIPCVHTAQVTHTHKCWLACSHTHSHRHRHTGKYGAHLHCITHTIRDTICDIKNSRPHPYTHRHRHTGKYEAHLWDSSVKRVTNKKGGRTRGKQIYLGEGGALHHCVVCVCVCVCVSARVRACV